MKDSIILDRYLHVINDIEEITPSHVVPFAREIAERHRRGWRIPDSTYKRQKDRLFYKKSLDRNSPYYIDLFKIEDKENLKIVLLDLYYTIRFTKKGI